MSELDDAMVWVAQPTSPLEPTIMNALNSGDLRQEIGFVGAVLGETVREFAGDEAFAVIESLRRAAWDRRVGLEHADTDPEELRHLTRLSINGIAAGMRTSG